MNEIIIDIFILLCALIVHEIGHLIGFWIFKYKPNITMKWYGVIHVGENIWHLLKPREAYLVYVFGIVFGIIIIMITNQELLPIYIIMCCIDISGIIEIIGMDKKYKNNTLLEISEIEINKLKTKLNKK